MKVTIPTLAAIATTAALISAPVMATQPVTPMNTIIVAANQTDAPDVKGGKTPKAELPARSEWMTLKQAHAALEKAGYQDKDIRSISSSRYGYIARVVDKDEKRIRLLVHPTDGTVTIQERRKDDRRKHRHHKNNTDNT